MTYGKEYLLCLPATALIVLLKTDRVLCTCKRVRNPEFTIFLTLKYTIRNPGPESIYTELGIRNPNGFWIPSHGEKQRSSFKKPVSVQSAKSLLAKYLALFWQ